MKYDVSNIIKAAYDRGITNYRIAKTGKISVPTLRYAAKGRLVKTGTKDDILQAIAICDQQTSKADDVAFNQGHEVSTEQLAANLEKQVEQLRGTVTGSGLVDDAIESAHSREKAELQKALAARIGEVQNLAADVAYERQKNETQYQSIGQCFAEIKRLQDELNHQKLITASRNADLAVYQKALEDADARVDDAEYKAAELKRDLTVQRAWTWFFLVLSFVAAVVRVVK